MMLRHRFAEQIKATENISRWSAGILACGSPPSLAAIT
jgi:hypothetical protein